MNVPIISSTNKTYKLDYINKKINGFTDKIRALEQSIYCLLNTERYKHVIYSFSYGLQRDDLYGKPINQISSILQYRITNALMPDDRILLVSNFEFDSSENGILKVKFTVNSIYGETEINYEFNI